MSDEIDLELSSVDFHVHHSDETAISIIDKAKEKKIKGIALVGKLEFSAAIQHYINYGEKAGVVVIPGLETFAIGKNGERFDMLLFGFDPEAPSVSSIWSHEKRIGINREVAITEKTFLESMGFAFEDLIDEDSSLLENIMSGLVSAPGFRFCELIVKNSINSKKLLTWKLDNFDTWEQTRQNYSHKPPFDNPQMLEAKFLYNSLFAEGKPGFVGGTRTSEEIINRVHDAGGVAIYSPEGGFSLENWKSLVEEGVDGIMAWHSGKLGIKADGTVDISKNEILDIRKQDLLVLGGSDYTYWKNDWQMGNGRGDMHISARRLDELLSYIKRKNNGSLPWKNK